VLTHCSVCNTVTLQQGKSEQLLKNMLPNLRHVQVDNEALCYITMRTLKPLCSTVYSVMHIYSYSDKRLFAYRYCLLYTVTVSIDTDL
jgi:hypothetical protein